MSLHRSAFEHGYLIACANLVNLHDEPGMAADLIGELGMSWPAVVALGLSDYDMQALRKVKKERGGKVFPSGRKSAAAPPHNLAKGNND